MLPPRASRGEAVLTDCFCLQERGEKSKIFVRGMLPPALRAGDATARVDFRLQEREGRKANFCEGYALSPRSARGSSVDGLFLFTIGERRQSKIFVRVGLPPRAPRGGSSVSGLFLFIIGEKRRSKIFVRSMLPPCAARGGCKGTGGFLFTRARGQTMQIFRAAAALALTPKFKFCNSIIHKLVL